MSERDELTGALVAARYRLEGRLPGGADSTSVFAAVDTRGDTPVILRLLTVNSPVAVEEFQRHLLSVAGISHPVLVAPLDWGETTLAGEQFVFVVTERIADVSLRQLLDRGRRLSSAQTLVMGLDLCRALHHLHQLGIAHGDVRPAHVFVSSNSRARLAGIGVKRGIGGDAMSIEQARYAAPEFSIEPLATPASDIYALSLTLLETITGEVPFAADSLAVTLANRAGKLLPVSAAIGPIAVPIEEAGRPEPHDRSSALKLGQSLAQLAVKFLPPEPIEALATEAFRDTITRQLPIVVAEPTQRQSEPVVAARASKPADVSVVVPSAERKRYRWLWSVAGVVALAVSAFAVWQVLAVDSFEVPELVGVAEGEARNTVSPLGWNIVISAERSDEVALGGVIRTSPAAGAMLREGDDFILVISEGPTLAVVPDVTGLSQADAVAALEAQGLLVVETIRDDDSVPAGSVVSWIVTEQPNLLAGSQVLKGTQVAITVSGGPVLRAVPNLIGRSEADALAELAAVQLVAQRNDDVFSGDIAAGLVAAQEPQPAVQLSRGDVVAFSVSKGPETVELPRLIGLNLADAQKQLTEAGLVLGTMSGRTSSRVRSVDQDGVTLTAGSVVAKGSAVNLVFP
ncbi:MAG: PASTA domain-containing protein [Ilumatobacteraceae bacterium]|jgi:eukaryotic-like serine/threonine-protein kinase|nr:PASTA domain-containing protein [Ilumatobacteraceae bacterium]